MKIDHIDNFTKGWFVGNFDPSLLKANFEVGLHQHKAGEFHQDHFHKLGTEINVMVEGRILINGKTFGPGDIFVFEPYEVSQVRYLTDVKLIVVRDISDPNDKYEIEIKT
jgi:quercetin dioxygenase-like cupin family protein